MEILLELLFELILEILGQILFEIAAGLGGESLKQSLRKEREASPLLAGLGHLLMGLGAGVLSLLLFGQRVTSLSGMPGLSLVLAPIGTGVAMRGLGELWIRRGMDRPALFSFSRGSHLRFRHGSRALRVPGALAEAPLDIASGCG